MPAIVLDIEDGPKAGDRRGSAGDDGLLVAFNVDLDELAAWKLQPVDRQYADGFAAFVVQLNAAEIPRLAVIRHRDKGLAGLPAGRRLNGANIADLIEREIGA